MKKLLSAVLAVVMLVCAIPVFVRAEEEYPWADYDNYLFYNNSNLEKKVGYVTDYVFVQLTLHFDPNNVTADKFLGLAPLIDTIIYDNDTGYFILLIKDGELETDDNGYPIYTEEWLDQFIEGIYSLQESGNVGNFILNTAEILDPLKLDRTLSFGCKGDDVKLAQKYLAVYGYLTATPDGIFGAMSEAATIMFQAYCGLSYPDGKIGNWTLGKLNADSPVYFTYMSKGSSGNAVRVMQTYLKKLGYLSATPDGIFGAKTEAALRQFQTDNDLAVSGVADILTLSAVFNRNTKNRAYYTRTLKYGDRGNDVRRIQIQLYNLGYLSATPDGVFGAKTEAAVIIFQAFNGLENPDGKVGNWTRTKLSGDPNRFRPLSEGSRGTAVLVLQKYLEKLNYMNNTIDVINRNGELGAAYIPVKPDGEFGAFTRNAVKLFQHHNNITCNGKVGIATYTAIVIRTAKARVLDGKREDLPFMFWYN